MSWTPTQEQLDGMGPRDRVTSQGIERCVRGVDLGMICGCGVCRSERDEPIHVAETDHDCHDHVVHRVDETSRLGDYYECGHCHALLQVG